MTSKQPKIPSQLRFGGGAVRDGIDSTDVDIRKDPFQRNGLGRRRYSEGAPHIAHFAMCGFRRHGMLRGHDYSPGPRHA